MTLGFMIIPYMIHIYSSGYWFTDKLSIAIPIIGGLLLLFTFILMSITTFIDPGIIPRNKLPSYFINNNTSSSEDKHKKVIIHLGVKKKISKCLSCFIIRPFRSTHCGDCNNCVLRFDHHCPWIGNCVALRNYRYFFLFLSLLNIYCMFLLSVSIYHIYRVTNDNLKIIEKNKSSNNSLLYYNTEINSYSEVHDITTYSVSKTIGSLFVVVYCFIKMLFVTGLLIYHTILVSKNQTTKEDLKRTFYKTVQGNFYNRGCFKNWIMLFCCIRKSKKSTFDYLKEYKRKNNKIIKDQQIYSERKLTEEKNNHIKKIIEMNKNINSAMPNQV